MFVFRSTLILILLLHSRLSRLAILWLSSISCLMHRFGISVIATVSRFPCSPLSKKAAGGLFIDIDIPFQSTLKNRKVGGVGSGTIEFRIPYQFFFCFVVVFFSGRGNDVDNMRDTPTVMRQSSAGALPIDKRNPINCARAQATCDAGSRLITMLEKGMALLRPSKDKRRI